MSQTIGIGIMGLGTVGYGAATILQRNRDVLSIRTKMRFGARCCIGTGERNSAKAFRRDRSFRRVGH